MMRQDLTYAVRALLKNPGLSAVAILSLALALGANTTIFTLVNAVLLRPLPYPESDRLVVLNEQLIPASAPAQGSRTSSAPSSREASSSEASSGEAGKLLSVHPASYVEWQARARAFEALVLAQASLMRVDLGFQPARTITMGLFLGLRPPETRVAVLDQIVDRVENLPGVKAAGTIQFLPLRGMTCGTGFWHAEAAAGRDPSRTLPTECALVSGGYFAAMGIPLIEGRVFDRRDRSDSPRVVMVNRAFASRYFPDGRVVGRRVVVQTRDQVEAEIVGVVGDVRHQGLTSDPKPAVFSLHAQVPGYITSLVVRTDGDPFAHAAAIRRAIHEVDPTQAVSGAGSLEQDVAKVLERPRLQAVLVTCFAGIAVVLAVIGVYGLIAYVVTQRTHEIGIRVALGATRGKVFAELFGQGARLVGAGMAIGAVAAIAMRQVVAVFVFGVTSGDPLTYVSAALGFAAVAVAAVFIPAMRGARVEPMVALRGE